jgi:hypothetical protein
MTTFYPVCVTIALFVALILFDIFDQSPEKIAKHALAGLVVLFPMVYLSLNDMELVSWGLLAVPVIVLIICYFLGRSASSSMEKIAATDSTMTGSSTVAAASHKMSGLPTVAATSAPVSATGVSLLSMPANPLMSATTDASQNTYTPITACNMA